MGRRLSGIGMRVRILIACLEKHLVESCLILIHCVVCALHSLVSWHWVTYLGPECGYKFSPRDRPYTFPILTSTLGAFLERLANKRTQGNL